ncbi:MAG: hypothetical protein AAFR13_10125, partial [Pseudomonadota bacterium]
METAATDVVTIDGVTVTTSGSEVGGRTSDTLALQPGTTSNGFTGVISSALNATADNEVSYQEVVFTFSEPVYNLRFTTADIDRVSNGSAFFTDLIEFSSDNGFPVGTTIGANVGYSALTGRAISNGDPDCNGNIARCQITVDFQDPVSTVTWRHVAADVINEASPFNSTNQAVQIRDLVWNTPPDATNNTAATTNFATVSGNVISDNDGSGTDTDLQDGAAVLVNQISHPDGTASVSGGSTVLTLTNGASLTIAPDGSYTFDPANAYLGLTAGTSTTETFTYRIEDQEGLFNTDGDVVRPDSVATLVVTINGAPPTPQFTVTKTVDQPAATATGPLTYTITVDNTGNVDLTGISVADVIAQGATPLMLSSGPTLTSGDTDTDSTLDLTETWVYTATYAVTQANLDDGADITNTATVSTVEAASQSASASTTTPGPTFACAGDNFSAANAISGISGSTVC